MALKQMKEFLENDCCGSGRNYPAVKTKELKQFREVCTQQEWDSFIEHATMHQERHSTNPN